MIGAWSLAHEKATEFATSKRPQGRRYEVRYVYRFLLATVVLGAIGYARLIETSGTRDPGISFWGLLAAAAVYCALAVGLLVVLDRRKRD